MITESSRLLAEQMIGLFSVAFEDETIRFSDESLDIALVTDSGVLLVEALAETLPGELTWFPFGDTVGVVGLVLPRSLTGISEAESLPVLRDPADVVPLEPLPSLWSPLKFWARGMLMSLVLGVRLPKAFDDAE